MKMGLGLKIIIFTCLLVIFTAAILIYFSYQMSYEDLEKSIGERMEAIATTGALMINGDLHDQIQSPADATSDAFLSLRDSLRKIKQKNNLEEVFTLRRVGNELKFIVMTHAKPFISDSRRIRKEMWPALNNGKSNYTGIYKDEQGEWISAYAPILDSKGNTSGIIDVEVEVNTFYMEVQKKISRLLIISTIILVMGILLSFILSRRLVKNLKYLSNVTEKISTGMVERTINIKSSDEIGELAQSLERIRISLKMAIEIIERQEEEKQ